MESILSASTSIWAWVSQIGNTVEYRWGVFHPDLLGGRPTVIGTRISLSQVLECLSIGMTAQEIAKDYPGFPADSVPEVPRFAAAHVAA